ncbi:tetratricopeptide repeat-containing glycosyltransferase family 2 protein [Paenibacillus turpanensis]|uniref:tetratricopeptide repeat-containing glycosyltransferase family 2 protein n=1 Tax=Paenibacillus turpanensis TaxID=2689078 RepID=UPI00140C07A5|nr:glycosyltransferase family 2 protein [Paenibacillus turpanensis]
MNKLISLCMIVKNEEKVLDRCLNSIKDYVDEIIIVDTGSKDATIDIAKKYTDKLYNFEWINDFSAARNESLRYATGKWILVLDADEYMDQAEIKGLRQALLQQTPDPNVVYMLSIISFLGDQKSSTTTQGLVGRVFPNHLGYKYVRPLHEQIVCSEEGKTKSSKLPFKVYHSGYTNVALDEKNKHDRNMAIFEEMKKKQNLTPYDHFTLGNQYTMMNEPDKALEHHLSALENGNENEVWYRYNCLSIMQNYINSGQQLKAWNFSEQYFKEYYLFPDLLSMKGLVYLNIGLSNKAKELFLKALEVSEEKASNNEDIALFSQDLGTKFPLWQLVHLYEQEQNYNQCVYYLTKLILSNERDIKAQIKLTEILSLVESTESIVTFLDKLLKVNSSSEKMASTARIAILLGLAELAKYYVNTGNLESRLNTKDSLRYSLLCNNQEKFEALVGRLSEEEQKDPIVLKLLVGGSLVWNRYDYLIKVTPEINNEGYSYFCLAEKLLSDQEYLLTEQYYNEAFELLSGIYILGYYDTYDQLLSRMEVPAIINQLANFFYSKHQQQTAFVYLEYLANNNELSPQNCSNLAQYFENIGDTEQSITYLAKALELQPDWTKGYVQLYKLSDDPIQKKSSLEILSTIDPLYKSLLN